MHLDNAIPLDEPHAGIPRPRTGMFWLVSAYCAVGLLLAIMTAGLYRWQTEDPNSDFGPWWAGPLWGISWGQMTLLGLWGGLGPNPWWQRWLGVVSGFGYTLFQNELANLLGNVNADNGWYFVLLGRSLVWTWALFLLLRACRFVVATDSVSRTTGPRSHYSIGSILSVTCTVAVTLAVIMPLRRSNIGIDDAFSLDWEDGLQGVIGAATLLFLIWPTMVYRGRMIFAIMYSAMGIAAVVSAIGWLGQYAECGVIYGASFAAAEGLAVVVPLLVARFYGYRLAWRFPGADRRVTVQRAHPDLRIRAEDSA